MHRYLAEHTFLVETAQPRRRSCRYIHHEYASRRDFWMVWHLLLQWDLNLFKDIATTLTMRLRDMTEVDVGPRRADLPLHMKSTIGADWVWADDFLTGGSIPEQCKNTNRARSAAIYPEYFRAHWKGGESEHRKFELLLFTLDYSCFNGNSRDTELFERTDGREGVNRKHKTFKHEPQAYVASSLELRSPLAWLCRQTPRDGKASLMWSPPPPTYEERPQPLVCRRVPTLGPWIYDFGANETGTTDH